MNNNKLLAALVRNSRYAARKLRQNKGWTAVAVLSLALGIGANTAVFSIVDAVFFKPLAIRQPDRVFTIGSHAPDGKVLQEFGYPEYGALRDAGATVADIAAYSYASVDVGSIGGSERTLAGLVSDNYFATLGVALMAGRTFSTEEYGPPGLPVAVISQRLFRRQFQGDAAAFGKTISVNGRSFTVIGVSPDAFSGIVMGSAPDVWIPATVWEGIEQLPAAFRSLTFDPLSSNGYSWLSLFGRLKPGLGITEAGAQLEFRIEATRRNSIDLKPLADTRLPEQYAGSTPLVVGVIFAIVAGLLLIACANVAGMLVARAIAGQKEIAIRLALGARRSQVISEVLSESMLLAFLGGTAGVLVAVWVISAVETWRPRITMPIPVDIGLDFRVMGFAVLISTVSGIAAGALAAIRATAADPAVNLRQVSLSSAGDHWLFAPRNLLVVGQITISLVMLMGAGLLLRTFLNLQSIPIGFDPENLIVFNIDLQRHGYSEAAAIETYSHLLKRVRNVAGVESVSLTQYVPLNSSSSAWSYEPPVRRGIQIVQNSVSPDYFQTTRIPLLRGRPIAAKDVAGAPAVVVVNEAYVRIELQGRDPIGHRLNNNSVIVGLVRDNKNGSLRPSEEPRSYVPFAQVAQPRMSLLIRTRTKAKTMLEPLLRVAREVDPATPTTAAYVMTDQISGLLWQPRIAALSASAFALLAGLLAAVGVYGVVSFDVSRRMREIGIRVALGANRVDILRLVMLRALALGSIGVFLGIAASLALTRLLAGMLYEVNPTDLGVLAAITSLLIGVAGVSSLVPARRASQLDPVEVLRHS